MILAREGAAGTATRHSPRIMSSSSPAAAREVTGRGGTAFSFTFPVRRKGGLLLALVLCSLLFQTVQSLPLSGKG